MNETSEEKGVMVRGETQPKAATLPCSSACVAVLMVVGLPIFLSADLGLQVPFPCTQCNFLS